MFNNFLSENRVVYEIMWKNMVDPHRPQMTIRRMRFACWIPKATNTHSKYDILIAFSTAREVTRKSLNVTLYVHYLSCVLIVP